MVLYPKAMARLLPVRLGTLLEAGLPVETIDESSCDVVGKMLPTVEGSKLETLVVTDCCADETPLTVATVDWESVLEGVDRVDDNDGTSEDVGKEVEEEDDDDDDEEDAKDCDCALVGMVVGSK